MILKNVKKKYSIVLEILLPYCFYITDAILHLLLLAYASHNHLSKWCITMVGQPPFFLVFNN